MNILSTALLTGFLVLSTVTYAADGGITTLGLCKKSVPRDRISLSFTAVQQHASSKEAYALAQKNYESFRKGVIALKLKDFEVQTTDISLNPRMEWINNKNVNKGYEGRAGLQITTSSVERVGELYDLANKSGIQEFGSLRSFVSDTQFDVAYKKCLKDALVDARTKAQEIAAAASKKLGPLQYAAEQGAATMHPPMPMQMMAAKSMMDGGGAGAAIETGSGDIEVKVVATFDLQ